MLHAEGLESMKGNMLIIYHLTTFPEYMIANCKDQPQVKRTNALS